MNDDDSAAQIRQSQRAALQPLQPDREFRRGHRLDRCVGRSRGGIIDAV
jgi:hypothetical protein